MYAGIHVDRADSSRASLQRARAGGEYILWSSDDLVQQGLAVTRMTVVADDTPTVSRSPEATLTELRRAMEATHVARFVVLWRQHQQVAASHGFEDSVQVTSRWLARTVEHIAVSGGNVTVFRERDLMDFDEWAQFYHVLVEGKVPNEHGEVPIGGAY